MVKNMTYFKCKNLKYIIRCKYHTKYYRNCFFSAATINTEKHVRLLLNDTVPIVNQKHDFYNSMQGNTKKEVVIFHEITSY